MRLASCLFSLILLSSLIGCQPDTVDTPEQDNLQDTLSYEFSLIERHSPCADTADGDCINVKIKTIKITDGSSNEARQKIESYLNGQISATDNSDQSNQTPEEVADDLVNEYTRIIEEMPKYKLPWEYFREFDVYLNENGLFGVQLDAYSFTGGAHPANFEYYYTFDSDNGRALSVKDLFLPKFLAPLKDRAEEQFRNSRDIDSSTTYEEAGFWFENDEFALPDNFKYSPKELVFLYNPYEIAPYSEGSVVIMFDYKEIQNWVKPEYRFGGSTEKKLTDTSN